MRPVKRPLPDGQNGPVRTLMIDGKWLVPPKQRPPVLPPPAEVNEAKRKADAYLSGVNELGGHHFSRPARGHGYTIDKLRYK